MLLIVKLIKKTKKNSNFCHPDGGWVRLTFDKLAFQSQGSSAETQQDNVNGLRKSSD
jgi:hypothetical protein